MTPRPSHDALSQHDPSCRHACRAGGSSARSTSRADGLRPTRRSLFRRFESASTTSTGRRSGRSRYLPISSCTCLMRVRSSEGTSRRAARPADQLDADRVPHAHGRGSGRRPADAAGRPRTASRAVGAGPDHRRDRRKRRARRSPPDPPRPVSSSDSALESARRQPENQPQPSDDNRLDPNDDDSDGALVSRPASPGRQRSAGMLGLREDERVRSSCADASGYAGRVFTVAPRRPTSSRRLERRARTTLRRQGAGRQPSAARPRQPPPA